MGGLCDSFGASKCHNTIHDIIFANNRMQTSKQSTQKNRPEQQDEMSFVNL